MIVKITAQCTLEWYWGVPDALESDFATQYNCLAVSALEIVTVFQGALKVFWYCLLPSSSSQLKSVMLCEETNHHKLSLSQLQHASYTDRPTQYITLHYTHSYMNEYNCTLHDSVTPLSALNVHINTTHCDLKRTFTCIELREFSWSVIFLGFCVWPAGL